MKPLSHFSFPSSVLGLLLVTPALLLSQDAKPVVKRAESGRWELLSNATLSPDGKWIAYSISRVSGGSELRYRPVAVDSTRVVRGASGATFTGDGRWLIYTISPAAETEGAGRGGGRGGGGRGGRGGGDLGAQSAPPQNRNRVALIDLGTGATTTLPDILSFSLSADETHIALRRYAPAGRSSRGSDVVVRNLERGTDLTLGSVADLAWSPAGALLAMTIDVEGRTGNGVQVLNATTGAISPLDASDSRYSNITWRPKGDDLAAFRTRLDSAFADTSYSVLAWRALASATNAHPVTYDFGLDRTFPAGMRVSANRPLSWSEDGSDLFFGISARLPKPAPAGRGNATADNTPQPAAVEVWHWKDVRQQHQQELQAAQDRARTHLAVWHVAANTFTRLADDSLETVQLSQNQKAAIATDDTPYQRESMFGRPYRDVYRIDVASGRRERLVARISGAPRLAPDGHHVAYTNGGHWWIADLAAGTRVNLTAPIKSQFMNMEDDHPTAERSPYGIAGWTTGEKAVILYDRFDLWQVNADGTNAIRLTRGREDSTVYRRVNLDTEERFIDPSKPMYLTATGEWSKKSGYSRLTIGQLPERLVWLDKGVSALEKATKADVFVYQRQTYEESPNFFVGTGALKDAKQVTRTNPFQADYAWGRQELFTYKTKSGAQLQAMLTYPAGYKPGAKYPMVVYFYEKLSQGFHQYVTPSDRSLYSVQVFSQEGYFVLRPDIAFRPRDPGISALECVTAAVSAAVARAPIDPKRVGTMGHSWGGYESAFFATHSNGVFAAAIAGAPLTNLISMYGYTSGNSGAGETGHFEVGQERMQVPLWEDPQAYIRNSSVFSVDKLDIPLLLEEGDQDGNVNPFQSQELYNFGRRLGKNVVYLVYNGENHNLAQRNNQMDYQQRQIEWFDHYLKGNPPAKWITNGETYLERQKLLQGAGGGAGSAAAGGSGGRGGN